MPRKPAAKTRKNSRSGAVKLRTKPLANGAASLYLDIYHKGSRSYEFLKLYLTGDAHADSETLRLASTICSQRELELKSADHGIVPAHVRQRSFVEYFDALSKGKHASWTSALRHLEAFAKDHSVGALTFDTVTPRTVDALRAFIISRVSQNSARLYFSKYLHALRSATREGKFKRNPADGVEGIREKETERSFLTIDELRLLAKIPCPNQEVGRAFMFSCWTGLRVSDVRALRWEQIRNDAIEHRQQKTGNVEHLPLSEQARAILAEQRGIRGGLETVFHLPAQGNVNEALVKWAQRAGVTKPISFHVSRHTFGTLAYEYTGDLYAASKLLGHRSIKQTQVYARMVDTQKRSAVAKLPTL